MSSSRRFGLLLGTSAISTALSMLAAGLVIAEVPPQETIPAATTPPATPLIPPASDARGAMQWPKLPGLEIPPASVGLPATPAPSPTPSAAKPRGLVIAQAPPPETPPPTTPPAPAQSEVTPAPTTPEAPPPTPPGSTQ